MVTQERIVPAVQGMVQEGEMQNEFGNVVLWEMLLLAGDSRRRRHRPKSVLVQI
jgi:hypothetical protein